MTIEFFPIVIELYVPGWRVCVPEVVTSPKLGVCTAGGVMVASGSPDIGTLVSGHTVWGWVHVTLPPDPVDDRVPETPKDPAFRINAFPLVL